MKALKYFSIAALALLTVFSCNRKEVIEVGKPDVDGCQGVYFPAQLTNSSIMLDPSAPKTFKFKVARKESKGEFSVPLVVTDTAKLEKVFVVPEVKFADGQTETSFEVTFDKVKIGLPYALIMAVEDPLAVSTYTTNPTSIKVVFTVIEWKNKGKALFRDDLISSLYPGVPSKNAEIELDIYERGDLPGYYKFVQPYGTKMLAALWGNKYPEEDFKENITTQDAPFYIDARDPEKVLIPHQTLGCVLSSADGEISAGSVLPSGKILSYGTLEGGIITFPTKGLFVGVKAGGLAYGNGSGLFRVVLPGTVLVDYDFGIEVGENASDGNIPVSFQKGADVASVVYAAFEGKLNEEGLKDAVRKISKGEVDSQKTTETKIALKFDKTGIYTLVALALNDKNEVVNTAAEDFGYIAAGEDKPVVLNYGLVVSDQYKHLGYTAENSMAFYINGKEIKELRFVLIEASIYDAKPADCEKDLLKSKPKDAEFIGNVNGSGAAGVFEALSPGTEYVMLIAANNGYKTQIFPTKAKTAGKAKMAYRKFSLDQLEAPSLPSEAKGYDGKYNLYAKKITYAQSSTTVEPKRSYQGQVTVKTHPASGSVPGAKDTVVVSGVFAKLASSLKHTEDKFYVKFLFGSGLLHLFPETCPNVTIQGKTYYTIVEPLAATKSYGSLKNAVIGGRPETGIVAFYPSPAYFKAYGLSFTGLSIAAYSDPGFKDDSYAGSLAAFDDLLLVDPTIDDSELAPKPITGSAELGWGVRYPGVRSISERISLSNEIKLGTAEVAVVKEAPVKEVKAAAFTVSKVNTDVSRKLELRKDIIKF